MSKTDVKKIFGDFAEEAYRSLLSVVRKYFDAEVGTLTLEPGAKVVVRMETRCSGSYLDVTLGEAGETGKTYLSAARCASSDGRTVGRWLPDEVGNELSGTLLGMFEHKDLKRGGKYSRFFRVELDEPCQVRTEGGKLKVAEPFDVVCVPYGPRTKDWEKFLSSIRVEQYKVWLAGAQS